MNNNNFTLALEEVGINDIERVGGKNASLGEMLQHLTSMGIRIPGGFVITAYAYSAFISFNNLESTIRHIINTIDYDNLESLRRGGSQVRLLIQNGRFPKEMSETVIEE